MDRDEDKKLDDLIKKMVKEAGLEPPSADFTEEVFNKIKHINLQSRATTYQPLISRTTWGLLGMALLGIILYLLFGNVNNDTSWLSNVNLDFLSKYDIYTALSNSSISETVRYSIIGLIFFVYIQLFVLKRYMDRRISLG